MTWERVKELFHATVHLPEAEREARLADVEADIRREVELLLEAHVDLPYAEEPGSTIGRYKLLQQIGEGGFGVVYMAEQVEPVQRKVALKIIKLGMDSKQVVARFEQERQALAMMDHPNIARVLDGGVTGTGRPYFVMELVRGVPITRYCAEAKLDTPARLGLFQAVCRAVQHAHQKGVIHRDLKPNNVLVTLHDGDPVPKVIDFGVAKATGPRLTDKTLFTEFRTMIGTPEYMAPEQAEMSGLDVDTRADIYSLGVLLYELLTGTTPFDASELMSRGYDEVLRTIREVDPPRPSTRASTRGAEQKTHVPPRELGRLLRGDLDWIVMKALEKSRARRYETANALAADVGRYLAHEPVAAGPPSTAYRFRKYVRRHRALVVGTLAVFAALTVGLVLAYLSYRDAEHARGLEAERAKEARIEAEKARRTVELLDELLGGTGRIDKGPNYPLRQALLDFDQRVLERLEDQPEVEAQLRLTLLRGYLTVRAHEAAAQQVRLLRVLSHVFTPRQRAWFHAYDAQVLRSHDHFEKALAADERALAEMRAMPDADPAEIAFILLETASDHRLLRDLETAERLAKESLAMYERIGNDAARRHAWDELGTLYREWGKFDLAEKYIRQAVQASQELGVVMPYDDLQLARLLSDQGDFKGAAEFAQKALDGELKLRGEGTAVGAAATRLLALSAYRLDDLPRARRLAELALKRAKRTVLVHSFRLASYHSALGGVALAQSDFTVAEASVREAIAILDRAGRGDTRMAREQLSNLGFLLTKKGERAEAEKVLARAVAIAREHEDDRALYHALDKRADALRLLGRGPEAVAAARESVAVFRRARPGHPDVVFPLAALTRALVTDRKYEEAAEVALELLSIARPLDHPIVPSVLNQLGAIELWREDYDAAVRYHKETYILFKRRLPPRDVRVARALRQLIESAIMAEQWSLVARAAEDELNMKVFARHESLEMLARGLTGMKKYAAAEKVWRMCHGLRAEKAPDSWIRYRAMARLGAVLLAQDKLDEAEPLLAEALQQLKKTPDAKEEAAATEARLAELKKRRAG